MDRPSSFFYGQIIDIAKVEPIPRGDGKSSPPRVYKVRGVLRFPGSASPVEVFFLGPKYGELSQDLGNMAGWYRNIGSMPGRSREFFRMRLGKEDRFDCELFNITGAPMKEHDARLLAYEPA